MKGVELPINTLIIIVLAVIILLALISIFYTTSKPSEGVMGLESARTSACQLYTASSCSRDLDVITINNFDANKNGRTGDGTGINGMEPWDYATNCGSGVTSGDNLATLCRCFYDIDIINDCARTICSCGASSSGSGGPLPPPPP